MALVAPTASLPPCAQRPSPAPTRTPALGLIDGRYRLGALLGRGSSGEVYEARDLRSHCDVALKLLARQAGGVGDEFLTLRHLVHPNVVRVLDVGRANDAQDYIAMELLRGPPIAELWAREGVAGLVRFLAGCARALERIHARGLVHGDIKPSNILLAGPGDARLVDFGLAARSGAHARGTPAYMAPELQRGAGTSPAADIYALGASAYELVAGANPFEADTVADTLRRHRELEPPDLTGLPAALNQLLGHMLAKAPESRLSSARELLHALEQLPESEGASAGLCLPGPPMRRGVGPFVGRRALIDELLGLAAPAGEAGVIVLRGAPGAGRSRLLDELRVRARLAGRHCELISAAEASADRTLIHLLHALGGEAADFEAETAGIDTLGSALLTRARKIAAHSPLLLLIDDLDIADPDLRPWLRALVHVFGHHDNAAVIASVRVDAEPAAELVGCEASERRLSPLDGAEVRTLVRTVLGDGPRLESLAELLWESSAGNPRRLQALLTRAWEQERLSWREGRWTVDPLLLSEGPSALRGAADAGAGELARSLPPRTLEALQVAALYGESFTLAALTPLLGDAAPTPADFEAAVHRDLLRQEGAHFYFVEAGERATLIAALSEARRATLHETAARQLARQRPTPHEAVARHLDGAGLRPEALEVMEEAVAHAAEQGRPAHAAKLVRWLAERAPDAGARAAYEERAGQLEQQRGDLSAARAHYRAAIAAADPVPARLHRRLGYLLTEAGRYGDALPLLEMALRKLHRDADPHEELEILFALGWTHMMAGQYEEASDHAARGLERAGRQRLPVVARLRRLEGTIRWHRGDAGGARRSFRRGAALAAWLDDRETLAECRMGLGTALRIGGDLPGAAREYREALQLNEDLGRQAQAAKCLNNLGIVHYLSGDWSTAIQSWQGFRDSCVRSGDRPDLVMAHNNLGFLYKDRGELERAERELRQGLRIAIDASFARGHAMVAGNLGEVCTRLGDYAQARRLLAEACELAQEIGSDDELLENRRRQCELDLAEGDIDAVLARVEALADEARQAGNGTEYGLLLRAHGLALLQQGNSEEAVAHLETARLILDRKGSALDRARTELPLARALLALDSQRPERLANAARDVASRFGAGDLLAAAEHTLRDISDASAKARVEGPLLAVARDLTAQLELSELLPLVAERALELTGAQRGLVALYEDDGEVTVHAARWRQEDLDNHLALRISRTIADRAWREDRAVVVSDVLGDGELRSQSSILDLKLRSVICVPLRAGDKRLGILYVDSQVPTGGFEAGEVEVLEALASQAAIAVQNARMFCAERRRREEVAAIAHDFRTPLAAARSTLQLVAGRLGDDDEALRELIDATTVQLQSLARMSDEVVRLERLSAGRVRCQKVSFPVGGFLSSMVRQLGPMAAEHEVRLEVDVATDLPRMFADPDLVNRVVNNLVGNAIRILGDGGTVTLRAELATPEDLRPPSHSEPAVALGWAPSREGQWLRFEVLDDGPGISPEERTVLLERFTQGRAKQGGAGLGLAITRQLVALHGGQLWIADSAEGARFCFTLPCAPASQDEATHTR